MTNPRIGYSNIFQLHKSNTWCSSEETGSPGVNACDMRPGTKWKSKESSNLLLNGDMLEWAGGPPMPSHWTKSAAGSVAAVSTHKIPPWSALMTRAPADCWLYQDIADPTDYRGKTYTFGAWLRRYTGASRAYILLYDGVGTTNSAILVNDGAWHWITVTRLLSHATTVFRCQLSIDTANGSVYMDGAACVEGSTIAQTPRPPETAYLTVYPHSADDEIAISNSWFPGWSDGPSAPPDGWTEEAGTNAFLQPGTLGKYSVRFTGTVGNYRKILHEFTGDRLAAILGKYARVGMHVYATIALLIGIKYQCRDGSTEVYAIEATHGGAGWEWLATSAAHIPHDAIKVWVYAVVPNLNGACVVDSARFNVGTAAVAAPTEPPDTTTCTYFACTGHDFGTRGITVTFQGSNDDSNWNNIVAVSPTTDKAFWRDFAAVNYSHYRVKLSGVQGSQAGSVGVFSAGQYLELPSAVQVGYDPNPNNYVSDIATTRYGTWVGAAVKNPPVAINLEVADVEESWLVSSASPGWPEFMRHAGYPDGKPFFLQWDDGDHESDTWYCHLSSGTVLSTPLSKRASGTRYSERLSIRIMGEQE